MLSRVLALVCSGVLVVLPVRTTSAPLGHVSAARGAEISGVTVAPGTTVFDGDRVSVPAGGAATLDLTGGSTVEISSGANIRLDEDGGRVNIHLDRGGVRLTSSGKLSPTGRLADLVFTPASHSSSAIGWMGVTGGTKVTLFAEKGDWVAYTANNGRSVTLRPGEELRGAVSAGTVQETEGAQEKKKKKRKLGVIWIGTAAVGAATGLGMAFGMSECNVNSGPCPPPPPVASPVAP